MYYEKTQEAFNARKVVIMAKKAIKKKVAKKAKKVAAKAAAPKKAPPLKTRSVRFEGKKLEAATKRKIDIPALCRNALDKALAAKWAN